jgi:hypothetical protein
LHALVGGHILEFYLEKNTNSTTMYGPWWSYFLMSHCVVVNDVVTFKLREIGDKDAEILEYEEEVADDLFEVSVADHAGNKKPFNLMHGMYINSLDTCSVFLNAYYLV